MNLFSKKYYKPFIINKITILLIMVLASNVLLAQDDLLEKKINFKATDITVREVLKTLKNNGGLEFSYNEKEMPMTRIIKLSSTQLSVKEVLTLLRESAGIEYVFANGYFILKRNKSTKKITLSGYVNDGTNGESLIGATVVVDKTNLVAVTNVYGYYSLTLDEGDYGIIISYIGYETVNKKISLTENAKINIQLPFETKELKEVVISSEKRNAKTINPILGINKISSKEISKIPAIFGETDVLKVIRLMPGVQPTSELNSNFSVRGGGKDQNLILLDEANVYNPSHMMGFFSVFNNDAIKGMDFYRGNIPAQYGGRLSSVLDVRMKEGNDKKFSGSGGIGLISSRLTLESPIVKDKGSVIISGRRTYIDILAKPVISEMKNTKLYFYDFNFKANYSITQKDRIYLSSYLGRDNFGIKIGDSDMGMNWGNNTYTLRWNHEFSPKLFSNVSFIYSNFDYQTITGLGSFQFDWRAQMKDNTAKLDFNYYLNPQNIIKFGASFSYHTIYPGEVTFKTKDENLVLSNPNNYSYEHAYYASNEQKIGDRIILLYGLRMSIFQNVGKGRVDNFDSNYAFVSSTDFSSGKVYHTYPVLEPRAGATYLINENNSIKAGYSRTYQFMHLASNASSGLPLDIWFPSSPNIKPQKADIYTIGYFTALHDNEYEASVELFNKNMDNLIDFKDHASLLMNEHLEGEIRSGTGTAYGCEFMFQKKKGKLTGWISYTYSNSERKTKGVNNGQTYLSSFDRPHNLSILASYEITSKWTINSTYVYMTGAPVTLPTGKMYYNNYYIPVYSDRNGDRLSNYHRMDLSIEYQIRKKEINGYNLSLSASAYNVLNNYNPMSLMFKTDNYTADKNAEIYYMPFIPSFTLNFTF